MERTLGTVTGGLIGLGVVQLGDSLGPFLSPTDTAFTSAPGSLRGALADTTQVAAMQAEVG